MESIISMNDMSKEEILNILELARKIDETPDDEKLKFLYGKIIATLFFEPSTRTKMSFESAAQRLGAQVLQLPPVEQSSLKKGESFRDTIKMVEAYSDLIVVRHPLDGAARLADETSKKAIINAGDGSNQHPSQTLLDLYTILEEKGSLENLEIAFVGDLKYGRTVHSLVKALTHFNPKIYFIAPQILQMPQYLLDELDKNNIKYVYPFMKIKDNQTYLVEEDVRIDSNMGIYIDIFPVDGYEDDQSFKEKMTKIIKKRQLSCYTFKGITNTKSVVNSIIRYISVIIFYFTNTNKYVSQIDELAKSRKVEDYEQVDYLIYKDMNKPVWERKWLEEVEIGIFEGKEFLIPKHYHEILTSDYGDYMQLPPVEQQVSHHDFKLWKIVENE